MKLTVKMRQWLVDTMDVAEDATDETFRKAAGEALVDSENSGLTTEKLIELSTTKEDKKTDEFSTVLDDLAKSISEFKQAAIDTAKKDTKTEDVKDTKSEDTKETPTDTKETKSDDEKASGSPESKERKPTALEKKLMSIGSPGLYDEEEEFDVRVKSAVESYTDTKSAMHYPEETMRGTPHRLAGERVKDFGRSLDTASDLDMALAGVWAKFQIYAVTKAFGGNTRDAFNRLTDHEKSLMVHLTEKGDWDDSKDGHETARLSSRKGFPGGIKALIDDATSGGLEAAPIVFDDRVIETPLLYGELFPLVNTITLDRGRRIEGVATGTVTGSWGGVDVTPIALFDTTAYVSAFDTTVFRWQGAVQLGLDFLSDTPIDFGAHITRQYGERLLEDLDDVIATGNGSTQPEGIMSKSGTTSVTFSGATSISNYESLRFGVAKPEFRGPVGRTSVFCGTETSYQRCIGLPVSATDARRLFGVDHFGPDGGGYRFGGASYRINESLTNQQIFHCVMGRYRMYRRKGLAIKTSTEGQTLMLANAMLITAMARYGGQLERGAVAAKTTDAPA